MNKLNAAVDIIADVERIANHFRHSQQFSEKVPNLAERILATDGDNYYRDLFTNFKTSMYLHPVTPIEV